MRAHLLSTLCPALVLLVAACGPSDTASTDSAAPTETAAAPTTPPASPPPPPAAPAPTQTAAATPPAAGAAPAEDPAVAAVALRQAPMKLLSYNFGPMRGMMQGNAPFDAAVVATNTARMAAIANMIPGVFTTDTTSSTATLDTTALPAIWTSKADFDAKAAALAEAATAAAAAAAGGDQQATMAAVGAIGMACSGCHDDFRSQ